MFVVTCVVSTVEGESTKDERLRKLEVVKLLAQFPQPDLWLKVKGNILEYGRLNLSDVNMKQDMYHLTAFLTSGLAAEDITTLK